MISLYVLLLATLTSPITTAVAQGLPVGSDSIRAEIQTRLRAFYFNLGHRNWDALTADILAAKVVAHRPAPESLLQPAPIVQNSRTCASTPAPAIDQAVITLDGDWAEVSVPRCTVALTGADEFRLIHFQDRWRFVYIDLFEEPVNLTVDR